MFNPAAAKGNANLVYQQFQAQGPPPHHQPPLPNQFQMFGTKNEFAPLMNIQTQPQAHQQQQLRFQLFNQTQHCKSYSLPANFQQEQQFQMPGVPAHGLMQPPPRLISANGDIPLPSGWELEKTTNGQAYYINHITKTTSWEDPRKLLNLPQNQVDINSQTRAVINSIPLPNGWEEARTMNNEVYYINHVTKTTTWEDPRLAIYMQQQQNRLNERNFSAYNSIDANRMLNSSSTSSICSTSSSSCSFTSSSSSLNDAKSAKKDHIKKSLDDLMAHKNAIIKQIDELTKQEMSIKSKLTNQEIDNVLKILNAAPSMNASKIHPQFNKENIMVSSNQIGTFDYTNENNANVNNLSNTSISSDNNDMDTTLVTDS